MIAATIATRKFEQLQQSVGDATKLCLIQQTLAVAVPIAIADLQAIGGPSEWDVGRVRAFAVVLGAKGDTILYRVKGETARMMARLCDCIAVLAFCPGGITIFGLHFEVPQSSKEEGA